MSAPPNSAPAPHVAPTLQKGVLLLGARRLLRLALWRLERRISQDHFNPTLSAQIDRVRVALEALR